MGVLNVTPDSFFDGGRYKTPAAILKQTEKMLKEGAHFIDIGACSSKPGAAGVSEDQEKERLLPIVALLIKEFPDIVLSIDTFRSGVAKEAAHRGAAMINDISAGNLDPNMIPTVAALGLPYIMMHMKGNPSNMQSQSQYKQLLQDIILYFSEKVEVAKSHGLYDLIIDPGYGFAKTTEQNFTLLKHSQLLLNLELPILTGLSRKSMIYKTLGTTAEKALNGTTALHMQALLNGSHILRVHDVAAAVECVTLFNALNEAQEL